MAGVRGRSSIVAVAEGASGRGDCEVERRHGVVPARLFGDIVRAIA